MNRTRDGQPSQPLRRLVAAAALLATPALLRAQHHDHHSSQFESLNQPGRIGLPEIRWAAG